MFPNVPELFPLPGDPLLPTVILFISPTVNKLPVIIETPPPPPPPPADSVGLPDWLLDPPPPPPPPPIQVIVCGLILEQVNCTVFVPGVSNNNVIVVPSYDGV